MSWENIIKTDDEDAFLFNIIDNDWEEELLDEYLKIHAKERKAKRDKDPEYQEYKKDLDKINKVIDEIDAVLKEIKEIRKLVGE